MIENTSGSVPSGPEGGDTRRRLTFHGSVMLLASLAAVAVALFPSPVPRAGSVRSAKDGLPYVWIESGDFQEGCSKFDDHCQSDEQPPHRVMLLRGFWMGKTEVTVAAYRRFAAATHRTMPPEPAIEGKNFNRGWADPAMPAVNVSWNDSVAYCEWVGGRLPTEAQWEYAARAELAEPVYGALPEIAWFRDAAATSADSVQRLFESGNTFHHAGSKAPNGFGLHDMLGNVCEWTADWYREGYDETATPLNPTGPASGKDRTIRGGSWMNSADRIRVSARAPRPPGTRNIDTGFRCAL